MNLELQKSDQFCFKSSISSIIVGVSCHVEGNTKL